MSQTPPSNFINEINKEQGGKNDVAKKAHRIKHERPKKPLTVFSIVAVLISFLMRNSF